MSDFDFLKEFAKNIDREKALEPSDEDCEKLAATLHAQERRKRRRNLMLAWAFPLAASVVFVLLSTLLWQTRLRADRMFAEVTRLQKESDIRNSILSTDTIKRHVSLIQYDTIYRTVVMQKFVPGTTTQVFAQNMGQQRDWFPQTTKNQNIGINNQQQTENNSLHQNTSQEANTASHFVATNQDTTRQIANTLLFGAGAKTSAVNIDGSGINQVDLVNSDSAAGDQFQRPQILAVKRDLPVLPLRDILPLKSHYLKRLPDAFDIAAAAHAPSLPPMPMIRRLRPHDAMIGVTGGILFPQTRDATALSNFIVGLNGQMAFGRNTRLLAGIEYGSTHFKVQGPALDNSNIPTLTPPSPNDLLDYVQVKQPLRDFSLGLRYVFSPDKRLRPLVGVAWVVEQTLEQTLQYEFRNTVTQEETYILVPLNAARFNAKGLQLELGVEWAFTKRLSFGLEGLYQKQYDTAVPLLAERWGLKSEITYRF